MRIESWGVVYVSSSRNPLRTEISQLQPIAAFLCLGSSSGKRL
ncbi:hypothetical protein [Xylanibacillus composti]|nr:hypothetical protein [Xylanibacillus composti]